MLRYHYILSLTSLKDSIFIMSSWEIRSHLFNFLLQSLLLKRFSFIKHIVCLLELCCSFRISNLNMKTSKPLSSWSRRIYYPLSKLKPHRLYNPIFHKSHFLRKHNKSKRHSGCFRVKASFSVVSTTGCATAVWRNSDTMLVKVNAELSYALVLTSIVILIIETNVSSGAVLHGWLANAQYLIFFFLMLTLKYDCDGLHL